MSEDEKGGFKAWLGPAGFQANGIRRMAEFIAILSLAAMVGMGLVLYVHAGDTKENAKKQEQNQEKIKDAIKEQTSATKLLTCVIYTGLTDEKKRDLSYEKRQAICR